MVDAELERMFVLDAASGPALPIDAASADDIVEAALVGAGFTPSGGGGSAGGSSGGGMSVGTKLGIIGGAALAIVAIVLLARPRQEQQIATVILPDAAIDAPMQVGDEEITIDPPDPAPAPPTARPDREAKTKPATRPRTNTDPTVDDLLGEANAKRAAKEWRESDILYGRVVDRAPNSLAAQTALVASGSLHLEHLRDPRGAAKRFRRALELAPSGAVAEDARWGLAEAARALHDDKAEAAALDDFLAHHASSPLAARAKARRAELP